MDPIEELGSSINYTHTVKKKKNVNNRARSYMQQEVDLQKTPFLFFPPGKEMLFLAIYFVTLPYIVGLVFLFFYVADGKTALFGSITVDSDMNFFLVWIIGYEILAAVIILWIVKNAIMFSYRNAQRQKASRRSSRKKRRRHP